MIVDRTGSHYIFLFSHRCINSDDPALYMAYQGKRLTNKEYLEHWGKWSFFDDREQLDELAHKLDPYVEEGTIPCIKYDRAPQRWAGKEQCFMGVYCDDRQRDEVSQLLSILGVDEKKWVYDRELKGEWLPGGEHLEKWIAAHGLTDEKAEKVREDVRQTLEALYENPDSTCYGWQQ